MITYIFCRNWKNFQNKNKQIFDRNSVDFYSESLFFLINLVFLFWNRDFSFWCFFRQVGRLYPDLPKNGEGPIAASTPRGSEYNNGFARVVSPRMAQPRDIYAGHQASSGRLPLWVRKKNSPNFKSFFQFNFFFSSGEFHHRNFGGDFWLLFVATRAQIFRWTIRFIILLIIWINSKIPLHWLMHKLFIELCRIFNLRILLRFCIIISVIFLVYIGIIIYCRHLLVPILFQLRWRYRYRPLFWVC